MRPPSYVESLNAAHHELMAADPRVVVIGEDLLDPYGGAFGVTRGLSSRFPERVFTSPISEAGIVGVAGGLAMGGARPIVEIMFGDFVLLAADQLVNHAAKFGPMYGGIEPPPLVVRTPVGGGRAYGPTHSQALEKHLLGTPGLRVVAPSLFHAPGQLLQTAVQRGGPTLFVESKRSYPEALIDQPGAPLACERSTGDWPTVVIRNAPWDRIDVGVVTYGSGALGLVPWLQQLAEDELGVAVALPSLLSEPDISTLDAVATHARSGLVLWEEGTEGFGWTAEIAARLLERFGRRLPPVRRVSALSTVLPASLPLERHVLQGLERVRTLVLELVGQSIRSPR